MTEGFLQAATNYPASTALIVADEAYTYGQLYAASQTIAAALDTADEQRQQLLIGVYTDNNFYTYAAMLGVLLSGRGFVPLNAKFPALRLNEIISQSGLSTALCCESSAEKASQINSNLQWLPADALPQADYTARQTTGEQTAYILFTSGSTGKPKGISITLNNFNALLQAMYTLYGQSAAQKVLQAFELSFDVSLACTFYAFSIGATLVVSSVEGIVPVNALKTIRQHQVDFVTLPPSAAVYLKKFRLLKPDSLPFIKYTLFTGEAMPFAIVADWKTAAPNTIIHNAYGPTEVTVWCLIYELEADTAEQLINGFCPIGKALQGLEYTITDDEGNPVTEGEKGELWIAGPQVFNGYWQDEERTHIAITEKNGKRWYKTGDLVIENDRGNVVYTTRKDNQVQINGFRVELAEVEFHIKNITGIDNVVVFEKRPENADISELVAVIENCPDVAAVHEKAPTVLPPYMIPKHIYSVAEMPVNNSGKIDRLKLKAQYL